MGFLKIKLEKKLLFVLGGPIAGLLLFAFVLAPVRAAFVEDAGVGSSSVQAGQSFWLKFSESVNREGVDITAWSGWPLLSIMAHSIALIGGYPDENGNISLGAIRGSLIGGLARAINITYQQPVSSVEYLAYVSRNLNIAPPVYAQGEGWTFLTPVLEVWKAMRDITYIFFTVIFVGIGFIIMFRAKIDPQTVASIQNSLPRIVIALVLVTFSYAIAGLIVDSAFLTNGLIKKTILGQDPIKITIKLAIDEINKERAGRGASLLQSPLETVNIDVVIEMFWQYIDVIDIVGVKGGGLSIALGLIFALIVVSAAFRLFLSLLTKYITLLLTVLIAPFAFLFGALPGQGTSGTWFRTMLSAATTFPAVFLVLNLAIYFASTAAAYQNLPPFSLDIFTGGGVPGAPTLGPGKLIGLGIFLVTPKIPELIDSLFKAERPAAVAGAISPELAAGLRRIPVIGGLLG